MKILIICLLTLTLITPTTQSLRPPIVSRAEWGSKALPIDESRRHTPRVLTLHHAGVLWNDADDPVKKLQGLQSWGQREKNWPDVPYHFLISPDGRIFEGRDINYQPETNTKYELDGIVNIQLWGNFDQQRVNEAQLRSTAKLLAYLSRAYDLDLSLLQGHKDAAPGQTTCPGDDFHRYLESGLILRWTRQAMEGEEPSIELLPPRPQGPTTMISTAP